MPSGSDVKEAVQWFACKLKELDVSTKVTDFCPPNLNPDTLWSFVVVSLCVLGVVLGALGTMYLWIKKIRRWNQCLERRKDAVNAIADSQSNKVYLAKMTRKDCRIQKKFWADSLKEAKSEEEFQRLKRYYMRHFCLADKLTGVYSFS